MKSIVPFLICLSCGIYISSASYDHAENPTHFKNDSNTIKADKAEKVEPGETEEFMFDTAEFSPTHDAYLQGSTRYNSTLLRLQQGSRTSYLQYDLGTINGTITQVQLQLTISADSGNGTVTVYEGSNSNWTESNLGTSNAPAQGAALATRSSSGSGLHTYDLSVANPQIYSGNISFVLVHTGTNDLAYASSEHGTTTIRPKLVITYTVGGDTTAPTAPSLSSTGQTDTTADLSWSGATDNVGVTGYKLFQDGNEIPNIGNVTTYQASALTAQTTYSFTVTALDAAGNESASSNAVSVTTDTAAGGGGSGGSWTENGNDIYYTAGKVGVGTSSPDYELTVKGKIHAEEVKVDLQVPAPDYVFKTDYSLLSLDEVQNHIDQYGHLPNIPSAREMEENGVNLGTMEMRLLEKIEELTLYLLQQEEQIQQLQQRRSLLENCAKNRNKYK